MNFNISKETKKEILQAAKLRHEENLYTSLCNAGVDPDDFDINTYVPSDAENDLAQADIVENITKYNLIIQKIMELD
jgi:hypothetical protein